MKVIRLVARSTVEEIVLKKADEKLKLTNLVIEGGQVSCGVKLLLKRSLTILVRDEISLTVLFCTFEGVRLRHFFQILFLSGVHTFAVVE